MKLSKIDIYNLLNIFYDKYTNEYLEYYINDNSKGYPKGKDLLLKLKINFPDKYNDIINKLEFNKYCYGKIHKILNILIKYEINNNIYNIINVTNKPYIVYCLYQNGETCKFENETYERIVYIGQGNKKRLPSYARVNWYPPLKKKIHEALAIENGLSINEFDPIKVDEYVKGKFEYQFLEFSSSEEAKDFEKKIIPTIAQNSNYFISEHWLGKLLKLPYGVWNKMYTDHEQIFNEKDINELYDLVKIQHQERSKMNN